MVWKSRKAISVLSLLILPFGVGEAARAQSAATPPPTIVTVKAVALCAALKNTVMQTVSGFQANDNLMNQGQLLMGKREFDVASGIRNVATGGSAPSVQMDDNQMNQLASSMENNVLKLEALLADKQLVPKDERSDDGRLLVETRTRLQAVLSEQKKALNIIEEEVNTNMASDLANKCNPITCVGLKAPPTPGRVDYRVTLVSQVGVEQQQESALSQVILVDVNRCK